jgi:hypothetical protein
LPATANKKVPFAPDELANAHNSLFFPLEVNYGHATFCLQEATFSSGKGHQKTYSFYIQNLLPNRVGNANLWKY